MNKSSSKTATSTETQNLNLQDIDGIAVAGSEHVNIDITSPEAFKFSASTVDAAMQTTREALERIEKSEKQAFDFALNANTGAWEYARALTQPQVSTEKLVKYGAITAAVVVLGSVIIAKAK